MKKLDGKKIMVTKATMPPFEEYIKEIEGLWDSHWLTNMGEKHKQFQKKLEDYLEVDNVELMVNGHMALEMTIQAFELDGEIITTPFTFASTTHAIVRNGIRPVFCDIKTDDYTIDVSQIESLITEKTSAIIPVHVYGNICDVEEIQRIADKYNLKVIYDAAHAFGEKKDDKGVGTFGDASCFSFHATKVFNSIEGGAVVFKDETIGEKLYNLKNFGIHGKEKVSDVGANAKMNEFAAAMGLCNLKYINENIQKRKTIFDRYTQHLSDVPGIKLKSNEYFNGIKRNYSYCPILIDEHQFGTDRDKVAEELALNDIYARKYFYPIASAFDCYSDIFNPEETPVALDVSKRVLALPIFPDLSIEEIDKICDIVLSCGKI